MFELSNSLDDSKFSWEALGDIENGRNNLGTSMPVTVYRILQYSIRDELVKRFGNDVMVDVFRNAGELAGKEFAKHLLNLELPFNEFVAHLQHVLEKNKIGILRIEKFDLTTGEAILTVSEDLDCSGLPITGKTVCNYDEGFLAGVLKMYAKKNYSVTEVDCWATGSRVCRFKASIKD